MEMENSSSRSPDSSCPDYYSFPACLEEHANETHSSGILDTILNSHISSSTGTSVSSSTFGSFQNQRLEGNNDRNRQIPENVSREQGNQNTERSVINLVLSKDANDTYRSIPKNSLSEQSFSNSLGSVSSFPAVGSYWSGSSSAANNSGSSMPSSNYHNSSISSGTVAHNICNTAIGQEHISHGPPSYTKPKMPYFASTSSTLSASTTATVSFPKTEHSDVSSSVSSNSNYLSVPSTNTNTANRQLSVRQRRYNIAAQIVPSTAQPPLLLTRHISPAKQRLFAYNLTPQQPDQSAKNSHEERGLKRKSSPASNNLDCASSASSSNSNCVNTEQSKSNNAKKNKMLGSSSYLELEQIDDDIQIITPGTSRDFQKPSYLLIAGQSSSASGSSGTSCSATNHHKPSVILDGSRLYSSTNTAKETVSECDQNQSSRQTAQEIPQTQSLSTEDFEHLLDSVWSDLGEFEPSTNATSATVSTVETITIPTVETITIPTVETITIPTVSEGDDSSSSSIVSIHEVLKDKNSCDADKPPSPTLKKVPNDIPSLITIEDSPKNGELLELKAKQEAENVKEDFKKLLEDELICNICTELLIKPLTLGCSHTFCKFCISEWKEKKNQCPMCRTEIATETPCLFLDNFIGKAVEQLDPTSVEKRLEIIQSREEQLKKKASKPPAQLLTFSNLSQQSHQTLNMPPYLGYHQTYANHEQPSSTLQRPPILLRQLSFMRRQQVGQLQQRMNMMQQNSNMMQQNSNLMQQNSSILQQSLNVPHQSLNIPQPSSSIPHQSSNIPQQSPSIRNLQLPSDLFLQSSNPHHVSVPMNGYFFF